MRPGCVLVTGSAGFIGQSVVATLARAGCEVIAGMRTRTPPQDPAAESPFVSSVQCDLDDPAGTTAAMAGAETVIHAAFGEIHLMTAQLAAVLAAADRVGVRGIVFLSSIAVYGERKGPIGESQPPCGRVDRYGAAKLVCEHMIRRWVATGEGRHRAVILRPGIVYGRASPFWIDKLVLRIGTGAWGTLGRWGEGRAALVHVSDVAGAAHRSLDWILEAPSGTPPCLTINVTGPECPTWNVYFEALAKAIGAYPLRTMGQIELGLRLTAGIGAKMLERAGVAPPAMLTLAPTPGELRLFGRSALYETHRAAATLGWRPIIDLRQGLARSLPAQASMT